MTAKKELGKKGEQLAIDFLKKNGYSILATNWRFQKAEIDIIAEKNKITVFVEVKTRSSGRYGYPEESVDWKKQNQLQRASSAYISKNNIGTEIRFDIISVTLKDNTPLIEHFEDAFFPK